MNTERDLRLFVLPLAMIPLWVWVNANGGAAHLPKGSLAPLVYAVVTVLGYLLLCRWWFPMDAIERWRGLRMPFFYGFLSPLLVLLFREKGPDWLALYLPREVVENLFLGTGLGFVGTLFSQVLIVGMVEEACKRIAACLTPEDTLSGRVGSGFAAGVGFGIAEALLYSFREYDGQADVTMYVVRFVSLVALHGTWSAMTTFLTCHLGWMADDSLLHRALCLFPVAVLHGLYNSLLVHGMANGAAHVAFWTAFGFVVVYCVRRRMQDLEDEVEDSTIAWTPDWDRR